MNSERDAAGGERLARPLFEIVETDISIDEVVGRVSDQANGAVVTFVGLLQENSGFLIGWWTNLLRCTFGWGSYVVTLGAAALGVLLLVVKLPKRADVPWHVVTGAEIVFLALLGLTHLLIAGSDPWRVAQNGGGGGYVGAVFSGILAEYLGPIVAGLILSAVLAWGVVVASGISFEEWTERIEDWAYKTRSKLGNALMGRPADTATAIPASVSRRTASSMTSLPSPPRETFTTAGSVALAAIQSNPAATVLVVPNPAQSRTRTETRDTSLATP